MPKTKKNKAKNKHKSVTCIVFYVTQLGIFFTYSKKLKCRHFFIIITNNEWEKENNYKSEIYDIYFVRKNNPHVIPYNLD